MQRYHASTDPTYRPGISPVALDMPELPLVKANTSAKKTSFKKTTKTRDQPTHSNEKAARASKPQGITKPTKSTMKSPSRSTKPATEVPQRLTRSQMEKRWQQSQIQTHQKISDWTRQEHQRRARYEPQRLHDDMDMESVRNVTSIDMSDEDEESIGQHQSMKSGRTVRFQQPAKVLFRMAPTRTETSTGSLRLTGVDDGQTVEVGQRTDPNSSTKTLGVHEEVSTEKHGRQKGPSDAPVVGRDPMAPVSPITTTEAPFPSPEERHKLQYQPPSPPTSPETLLSELRSSPRGLELYEIQPLFDHIRNSIISFAEKQFSFSLDDAASMSWPLHLLATKYLPLLLTTQYIADGSQYGWRRFFTSSQTRPYLVAAVVGEYLKHHVFNATAFGFPEDVIEKLEDDDREYLHYDAFVRSKRRGSVMRMWFEEVAEFGKEAAMMRKLKKCAGSLAEELLQVVEPLMPPECFGRDQKGRWENAEGGKADSKRESIKTDLRKLIELAGFLHWGIRLKGEDGTIVRVAPSVQKGEKRYLDAPFEDVNAKMLNESEHHMGGEDGDKPRIRMTVFSRVEAVVPNGPTYLELVGIQNKALKDAEKEVDWEKVRKEQFVWPVVPDDVRAAEERKRGKLHEGEEMTAAYVTIYPILNKHKVYVEWESEAEKEHWSFQKDDGDEDDTKKDDERNARLEGDAHTDQSEKQRRRRMNKKYGVPFQKAKRLTLRQAVIEARAEKKLWLEDSWNRVQYLLAKYEPAYENLLALYLAGTGVSKLWFGHDWSEAMVWPWKSLLAVGHSIQAVLRTIKNGYQYYLVDRAVTHDLARAFNSGKATPRRIKQRFGDLAANGMSRISGRGAVKKTTSW